MSNIPLNTYVKITPFVQKWAKCSEPVYYIPNPGNAGDAAIATATVQFFHRWIQVRGATRFNEA